MTQMPPSPDSQDLQDSQDSSQSDNQKTSNKTSNKPSKKAKLSAARLFAVQGLYQILAADKTPGAALDDILGRRVHEKIDEEALVAPDQVLLTKILHGVDQQRQDLSQIVLAHYHKNEGKTVNSGQDLELPEGILFAVLLCGAYELMAHHDIDAPIIISEYVNVGHAYFDRGETRLINGVLDKIAKNIRD